MGDQSFVSAAVRARIRASAVPVAESLGRVGLTPNALTVLGLGIAALAGVAAGLELWLVAAVVSVAGAAFDLLDGALARATNRTSTFGNFLDSSLDRWGEGLVYAGVAAGGFAAGDGATVLLSTLAMSSAFMVSYTRAKAESVGFGGEVGIAPRPERIVILALGLAAAGLTGGPAGGPWLQIALLAVFTLSTITTIQRIAFVRRQAGEGRELTS